MGLFENKKKQEHTVAKELLPTLDRRELLTMIASQCGGLEWESDHLIERRLGLRLRLEFGGMRQIKERWSVQILLIAQHHWFDEDLVQVCFGSGSTPDEALRSSAEGFAAASAAGIIAALQSKEGRLITTQLRGRELTFRLPHEIAAQHQGDHSLRVSLWDIIRPELAPYLGTKRCYWVNMYFARLSDNPSCEVRINGSVIPGLTEKLAKSVLARQPHAKPFAAKEFALLVQSEETYHPAPTVYTKQHVGDLACWALEQMQDIEDAGSHEAVFARIRHAAEHPSLGTELCAFLPEITAAATVQYYDSDVLLPVVDHGVPDARLHKSQVRSYGYMEDAVEQYLRKAQPSQEQINRILAVSHKFNALHDAMMQGINAGPAELRLSELVYFVDQEYVVW